MVVLSPFRILSTLNTSSNIFEATLKLLGLRWEDIGLDERLIHIQRGVTFTSNQPIIGTPKTKAGYRVVPITDHLLPHLQSARKSGFVIGGDETPITQSTYDRAMERINKTINMHGATAHGTAPRSVQNGTLLRKNIRFPAPASACSQEKAP